MLRRRKRRKRRAPRRWVRGLVHLSHSATMIRAMEVLATQNKRVEIVRKHIPIQDLPEAFDGFRICQITDVHHGPFVDLEYISRVVDMANHLRPHVTVLTGDYVSHNPVFISPCVSALSGLEARLGVYAVLGNHDYWEGAEQIRDEFRRAGITELTNCGLALRRKKQEIYLAGLDDLWAGRPDLKSALAARQDGLVTILLSHNPDCAETVPASARVDLMLSGHTHGGQIKIVPERHARVPSRYGRKYLSGLVHAPHTRVYVSRGIGVSALPVRVLCPPELTLLELKRES